MEFGDVGLAVFSRAPVAGAAKKRLIPALGATGAAALQARMTRHIVEVAVEAAFADVTLWGYPDIEHTLFATLAHQYGIQLRAQPEGDLGEKMRFALSYTLRHHKHALLVGSDCPELHLHDLRRAACALRENDAVLGAAVDGGYVLIGMNVAERQIFEEIEWGTSQVLRQTAARFEGLGWRWREIGPFADIDRPEDLVRLGPEWTD